MVPIPVNSFSVYILKIETIYHGILAIEIHGRNSIYSLYLHHIETCLTTMFQIISSLISIQFLGQQPSCIPQPEKRSSVRIHQIAVLFTYFQLSMTPRLINRRFALCCCRKQPSFHHQKKE